MSGSLVTIRRDATMRDLKDLMQSRRISGVPVVENKRLYGMVTIEDLLVALERGALDAPVSAYMSPRPTSIRLGALAASALKLFQEHRFDDLPVVDADGRLAGMIDLQDLPKFKVF